MLSPKLLQKSQKDNLLKTKMILKPRYKLSRGPVFTFSLPGANSPLCAPLPPSYPTGFEEYDENAAGLFIAQVARQFGISDSVTAQSYMSCQRSRGGNQYSTSLLSAV